MRTVTLGDYIEILSGFAFKSSLFNSEARGLPLVRIRDVVPGYSETYSDEDFDEKYLLEDGDLLIGMDGEFNCARWKGGKALLNQRVCRVIASSKNLDDQYLFYFLPRPLKQIEAKSNFVTVKHLSVKQIQAIKIPLPPLEEQRRIAAILDKADGVRRKRKEAIRLTEELLRSTFLEMFGDPVTNPKGWEVIDLGKISQIQGGLQVTPARKELPLEVPYLRVANVYRDKLLLDEIKNIRVTSSELERINMKAGDILIVEGHGNKEEIGRSSVWDGSIENCVHQNHLIRVRLDPDKAEPIYISAYLNSAGGRCQLTKFGKTTSGLNTISTSNVKATKVLCPPIEMQKRYLDFQRKLTEAKNASVEHLEQSENLFNSLLQRAFRGEL
ncbi:MAG: restriction endonuclease subunit S [Microcystis sp. Msp_OC_L_20101000_S702]|uniref:restriction endonuclease subunit S n=1 Tax=Microcystis sp. Msp_OC_L_20101000_S702 TaxID=2486218 RepID=UPI00118FFFAC|nr:restriction endonuclease subunit S [Microcystis sp. Msp_OC_L_20101000_S702]TRU13110.1 MAG: restriction endonuclease subunit S [Microcystis sp. Msp_OC_L_20101000_S702]